jgi:hypothetical protein
MPCFCLTLLLPVFAKKLRGLFSEALLGPLELTCSADSAGSLLLGGEHENAPERVGLDVDVLIIW